MGVFWDRIRTSEVGKATWLSTKEAAGWGYSSMFGTNVTSEGFLGIKDTMAKTAKMSGGARAAGILGRTAMRAIFPIGFAYSVYSGYKERGIGGAVSEAGQTIAFGAAIRLGGGFLTNPFTLAVAGIAAAGYAGYQIGDMGRTHASKLRQIETGRDAPGFAALNSAGAATSRQRSVMALQNTHMNGRMMLGSEAQMLHIPYR